MLALFKFFLIIFYQVKLYSDLILHCIYVVFQVYGWYFWLHGGKNKTEAKIIVQTTPVRLGWFLGTLMMTGVWGYIMASYSDASVPYGDAFTTVASLSAQWMLVKKRLEAWIYWIMVDVAAIGIYFYKNLYVTTGLYSVFLVLAIIGYIGWKKSFKENKDVKNEDRINVG